MLYGTGVRQKQYSVLLAVLALVFPFHSTLGVRPITINASLGDIVIFFSLLLAVLGVISLRFLPRYGILVSLLIGSISLSIIINILIISPGYYSIPISIFEYIKLFGAIAWFFIIYVSFVKNPRISFYIFAIFSVSTATVFSIQSLYEIVVLNVSRSVGPFDNPNIYSNYLYFNIFLTFALAKIRRDRLLIWSIIVVILVAGVLATASRGGLVGMTAGIGVLLLYYLSNRDRHKLIKYSPSTVILIPIIILWKQTRSYEIIITTLIDPVGEASNRIERWEYAIDSFLQNPIFGLGYGQFAQATPSSTGVHSTFLSIGAEVGIFGLMFLTLLVTAVIVDSLRMVQHTTNTYIIYFVGFFIASLVQGLVTDIYTFRTFWIIIGILAAHYHHEYGVTYAK